MHFIRDAIYFSESGPDIIGSVVGQTTLHGGSRGTMMHLLR